MKLSDFLAYALKSIVQFILPELEDLTDRTRNEFDSFDDVLDLYYGGIKLPSGPLLDNLVKNIPLEMLKEIFRTDGEQLLKYPVPQVIQGMHQMNIFVFSHIFTNLVMFIAIYFDFFNEMEQTVKLHGGLMKNSPEKCLLELTRLSFVFLK